MSSNSEKWYANSIIQTLGAILTIITLISLFYENYRIPTQMEELKQRNVQLTKENGNKDSNIKKLENQIQQLQQANKEQEKNFQSQQIIIENQKKHIDDIKHSQNDLIQNQNINYNQMINSNNSLINENNELKRRINEWKAWSEQQTKELNICKSNADLQIKINTLRAKIEQNNNNLNKEGLYKPTDIQLQTYITDNQNLNNQILQYQKQLQCQH